jgi:PmbA protein
VSTAEVVQGIQAAATEDVEIWTVETTARDVVVRDGVVERHGSSTHDTVTTELLTPQGTGFVTTHGPADGAAVVETARDVARLVGSRAQPTPVSTGTNSLTSGSAPHEHFNDDDLVRLSSQYSPQGSDVHVEIRAHEEYWKVGTALSADATRMYETSLAEAICRVTVEKRYRVQLTQYYFGRNQSEITGLLQGNGLSRQVEQAYMMATLLGSPGHSADRVLLHSRISTRLLMMAMPSLAADAVEQQRSRLANLIGASVASPKVTVVENAAAEVAPLPRPWDDTGRPVRDVTLINHGTLENYLSSPRTAHISPVTSTSWRGVDGESSAIGVGHVTCSVDDEPERFEDLQSPEHLHILQANGLHMSNDVTGNFSFVGSGISVKKDGQLTSVHDAPISGNIFDLLKGIDGHDGIRATWRSGNSFLTAPGLWVRGLTVGAS